jgi:hypothetical protein
MRMRFGERRAVVVVKAAGALDGLRRRFRDVAESDVVLEREVLSGAPCDLNSGPVSPVEVPRCRWRVVRARTEVSR